MMRYLQTDVFKPGAKMTLAMRIAPGGTRLLVAQQMGIRPDGQIEKGLRAQLERSWLNLFATLEAAGFKKHHLIKTTVFVTEPGRMAMVREIRDRMLEGHACISTAYQVTALQAPQQLCELEAEAAIETAEHEGGAWR